VVIGFISTSVLWGFCKVTDIRTVIKIVA
jgi:hypothetical protein